jgi:glutaredoxin 3
MKHREAPIVIFTIYGCPYCQNAVRFLRKNNLPFKAFNIGNNAKMMTDLANSTGMATVPKVFVQGRFIGGHSDLMQAAESGQLGQMLAQPMA